MDILNGATRGFDMAMKVKVAILSDTHGSLDARIEAQVRRCDIAVHAGDVGGRAVLEALEPRAGMLLAVRGNNDTEDKWPDEETGLLDDLPREASIALPGGCLVIVHGDRAGRPKSRHQWLRAHYPSARAIAYGHSHRLCCDRSAHPWVLNPGAAGQIRTYGGPSCLILSAKRKGWEIVERRFEPRPKRRTR